MISVRVHESADEFRGVAEPLYRRGPISNTIELTLLESDGLPMGSLLLTAWEAGKPIGAALQTPRYPLACNGLPGRAIGAVVDTLVSDRPGLTGVRGSRARAVAFAEQWHVRTGRKAKITTEERLYRLGELRPPADVGGAARPATADDRACLVDWVGRFFGEAFPGAPNEGGREFVDAAARTRSQFVLWQVDGTPVSMAMLRVPAAGAVRIGPVFTPVDRRGRGFGSAVTAAASQRAREDGTPEVVLFADLANPTSNAIYQRIGFDAVEDSVRVEFGD